MPLRRRLALLVGLLAVAGTLVAVPSLARPPFGAGPAAAGALPSGTEAVRLGSGGLGRSYLLAPAAEGDAGTAAEGAGPARASPARARPTRASPARARPASRADAGARPLVVLLHGVAGAPAAFAAATGLLDLAARGEATVVVPAAWDPGGGRTSWNAGTCCGAARDAGLDDVGFVADVVADVRRRAAVGRVWVVGFSNGAMLGYRIACERPDLLSALVAVSGPRAVPCADARPVPVLHVQGGADRPVPAAGLPWSRRLDTRLRSVAASVAPFSRAAGCTGWSAAATPGADRRTATGCTVPVATVVVAGMPHRWTPEVTAEALGWLSPG